MYYIQASHGYIALCCILHTFSLQCKVAERGIMFYHVYYVYSITCGHSYNQSFHHQAKRIQFAGNNFRAFKTVNLSCGLIMSILSEIIPFNENILNLHQISLLLVLRLIVNMQVLHSDVK